MTNYKIAILFLTVLIIAWLAGCASSPEPVAPDDGIKVIIGGYIKGSTTIETGH
jgi:hypothetical protein